MTDLSIHLTTARRFILGWQGLWPGRRWQGPAGTAVALRATEAVQYVWEVYKPAQQRRWGYYTLPVLYGDRLAARFDPKLDRTTDTLLINGLWLETLSLAEDPQFVSALARGLQRFIQFLKAQSIDLSAVKASRAEVKLAQQLQSRLA